MCWQKVNQIFDKCRKPQLHTSHSSLNRLVIAQTDRQTDRCNLQNNSWRLGMLAIWHVQYTTDEWLLLRAFHLVDRGVKSQCSRSSRQTAQWQASVFQPRSFSWGLFIANPVGLTGAAGQVSNVPPLWRVFGSIIELDKGARRCLVCLRSHSYRVDPTPLT